MPRGAGLPQPILLGYRVQHAEVARMRTHQLLPERERILPRGERELVHEALEEHRVLVDVDAAPEPRRDVRVAHRVVDQQVRDAVAERVLARLREALERGGSRPFCSASGRRRARIDCPESRMCSPIRLLFASKPAGELPHHDRMVEAVQHVLLARPQQLHRRAGHLLGDQDGLVPRSPGPPRAGRTRRRGRACAPRPCSPAGRTRTSRWRTRPRRSASAPTPRTCRACRPRSRSSAPSARGSGTG